MTDDDDDDEDESDKHLEARDRRYSCLTFFSKIVWYEDNSNLSETHFLQELNMAQARHVFRKVSFESCGPTTYSASFQFA